MKAKRDTPKKEAKPTPFSVPEVTIATPKGKQLHLRGINEETPSSEDEHASDQFEDEEF
jgi:hypothetical protein